MKRLLICTGIFCLFANPVSAAGIKVFPSAVVVEAKEGLAAEAIFAVTNPTADREHIYASAERRGVRIEPGEFSLQPGEIKTVTAIVYPPDFCSFRCQIPVKFEAEAGSTVGAGVTVRIDIRRKRQLSWVEAAGGIALLIIALWITWFDRKNK